MTYRIEMTEQAETDLRDIFEYVAFSLLVPETAGKLCLLYTSDAADE